MKTLTTKRFFRVFFLFLAMISTLLLTACGGGGSDVIDNTDRIDNKKIVGEWFTNDINPFFESITFYDDGAVTATCPDVTLDSRCSYNMIGVWYTDGGILYIDFDTDEYTFSGSIENGSLKITVTNNEDKKSIIIDFTKKNDSGDSDNSKVLGVWYQNLEDGKPVKGSKIPSITFYSNGNYSSVDYDIVYDSEKDYWEGVGEAQYETGKWSANGNIIKITIEDYTVDATLNSDSITISVKDLESSHISTSIYKSTPYKDNNLDYDADKEKIYGIWYLNTEDELPVKGNIPTFDFKSDGSFTMVDYDLDLRNNEYWEGYGEPGYVTGTWSFSDGLVKVLVVAGKMTMEFTQNSLKLSGEYEDGSGTWTSIYKRTPYKDNNLDNDADKEKIYGKWYLNYDDDFPVKGNIPTFDFKSDGSVYIVEYELDFRNNEYWEGVGEPEYINGIWSLNGNTIRIIADDSYLDITVNSDTLTFTDESEDESDTWTFTYKKTKYVD